MTASPLLPPGMTGRMAETEATDAELSRMTELALSRGALARSLPCLVAVGAADGARTVAGGDGGLLVGEEDAVPHVSAADDRAQRRRAVETAVDPGAPVAAPPPFHVRPVGPAVGTQQDVVHGASWKTSPSVCRWPDRMTETPCRTGAADQPRADRTGRSRVVNT